MSPPTPDAAAALAVVRTFLSGVKARSPTQMHSTILPSGHATLIRPSPPPSAKKNILQITLEQTVDRIPFDGEVESGGTIAGAEWEDGGGDAGFISKPSSLCASHMIVRLEDDYSLIV
jgi:hypothetical protein